ncbi:uncharacterized protein LOC129727242 [Wyeomyia smithii]|uniref:uncharacterized protein LOC129727242 n=1 Tax=Wyeomyia smithii TaxID=174621 RepID=UPI002467BC76|nr:uncharacterized protein LOC129727242 [Wyeomyia smithii]
MDNNIGVENDIVVRRRSTLFNSNSNCSSSSPSTYKLSYEKQLKNEIENWNRLMNLKYKEIKELQRTQIELDASLLSEEQKRYLELGPNAENILQQANEFRSLAERYIQRKSFLAQRYDAILKDARAMVDNKALSVGERQLLSEETE